MNKFTIKDIENLTGIKSHTLRIWEQRYGIPNPKRTATNIRYYDDDDLKLLLNYSMLNRQGHKISKLTTLTLTELENLVVTTTGISECNNLHIDCLLKSMFNLDEEAFERVLSSSLMKQGIEKTMSELFFPFLNRVGVLWQTGQVNAAFEHFISNLIRQKLIVATDSLSSNLRPNSKSFVLFLPQGELHEIGLLFTNYILRQHGHKTIYLGQNLPHKELASLIRVQKTDYLITVMTSALEGMTVQQYITDLATRYPEQKILISGHQVCSDAALEFPENTQVIKSINEICDYIKSLH